MKRKPHPRSLSRGEGGLGDEEKASPSFSLRRRGRIRRLAEEIDCIRVQQIPEGLPISNHGCSPWKPAQHDAAYGSLPSKV